MSLPSIHHIRGWEITSDGEVVEYLKMCLAPSRAMQAELTFYSGAFEATTPRLAMLSPFFSEGTAFT
jgi:hypothetical protein